VVASREDNTPSRQALASDRRQTQETSILGRSRVRSDLITFRALVSSGRARIEEGIDPPLRVPRGVEGFDPGRALRNLPEPPRSAPRQVGVAHVQVRAGRMAPITLLCAAWRAGGRPAVTDRPLLHWAARPASPESQLLVACRSASSTGSGSHSRMAKPTQDLQPAQSEHAHRPPGQEHKVVHGLQGNGRQHRGLGRDSVGPEH